MTGFMTLLQKNIKKAKKAVDRGNEV